MLLRAPDALIPRVTRRAAVRRRPVAQRPGGATPARPAAHGLLQPRGRGVHVDEDLVIELIDDLDEELVVLGGYVQ